MVYDDRFEVKLSFHTVPERLVVPFQAIKSFIDPSVPFGISPNNFAPTVQRDAASGSLTTPETDDAQDRAALPKPAAKPGLAAIEPKTAEPAPPVAAEADSAKIVELDSFRKK
jgi:hypothetical protein